MQALISFYGTLTSNILILTAKNVLKCLLQSLKVSTNFNFSINLSFLLMTPFIIWVLDSKCAVLCGKALDRMKVYKICYNFHYCNMLGMNWKWVFFSKEWFLQCTNLGKIKFFHMI